MSISRRFLFTTFSFGVWKILFCLEGLINLVDVDCFNVLSRAEPFLAVRGGNIEITDLWKLIRLDRVSDHRAIFWLDGNREVLSTFRYHSKNVVLPFVWKHSP